MRHTIVGQRREDRARRTIAAGALATLLPVTAPCAAVWAGWGTDDIVRITLLATLAAAAAVSVLLRTVLRRMNEEQRRFDDERRHWRDEANTDPLCRIANRRGAYDQIGRFRETASPGAAWTVMALDIDRFKDVNDHHGHAVGDRVLASVAAVLAEHIPEHAAVARWGGDEFVIYLLGERAQPEGWAEEIADAVKATPVRSREGDLFVEVSYGLATGPSCNEFDDVLAIADEALLAAKASMRPPIELTEEPAVITVAARPRPKPTMAPTRA